MKSVARVVEERKCVIGVQVRLVFKSVSVKVSFTTTMYLRYDTFQYDVFNATVSLNPRKQKLDTLERLASMTLEKYTYCIRFEQNKFDGASISTQSI